MNKNDANIQMTNYIHTEIGCARKRKNYHEIKKFALTHTHTPRQTKEKKRM